MQKSKFRIAGIALVLAASTALSGCSAISGILEEVVGSGSVNDSSAFQIKVGDCFSEPDMGADELVSDVEFADCAEAHDNEAYASVLMTDDSFPGDEIAGNQGQDECLGRFLDFIGSDLEYEGYLTFSFFYPSQESWDGGDREILCYAYDQNGDTVGTLKNAAS